MTNLKIGSTLLPYNVVTGLLQVETPKIGFYSSGITKMIQNESQIATVIIKIEACHSPVTSLHNLQACGRPALSLHTQSGLLQACVKHVQTSSMPVAGLHRLIFYKSYLGGLSNMITNFSDVVASTAGILSILSSKNYINYFYNGLS